MAEYHGNTTTAKWNGQALGEVTAIGDQSITADLVEASIYNATDFFKKYIRSYLDAAEILLTVNFDPADTDGQVAYATDFYAGTKRTLQIVFPTAMGVIVSGSCIPVGLGSITPRDGVIQMNITVKPTGKLSYTYSTSTGLTTPFFALSESAVITPSASGSVYSYVATVLTGVSSITVTPTASAGTIVVKANGVEQTVSTGVASSAITLGAAGTNTEITITVTETGKAPKVYTIIVARAAG